MGKLKREFHRKLKPFIKAGTEQTVRLGNLSGTVSIPSRANYVYARTMRGNLIEVLNTRVPLIWDHLAYMGEIDGRMQITRLRNVYQEFQYPDVPPHAELHQYESQGPDVPYISGEQFRPWLAIPATGLYIDLTGAILRGTTWVDGGVTTLDLTAHIPASGTDARFVLLTLGPTGTLTLTDGTIKSERGALVITDIPAIPAQHRPLWAIRCYHGQTIFAMNPTGDTDLWDLRWSWLQFGDTFSPSTNHAGYIPSWNGANSKTLADGYEVKTSVGTPGVDTKLVTEKAVRDSLTPASVGSPALVSPSVAGNFVSFSNITGGQADSGVSAASFDAAGAAATVQGNLATHIGLNGTSVHGLGTISTQASSAVAITGGTITGLTGLAIRDTSAAYDVTLAATSSTPLAAGRTLTVDMVDASRTLKMQGDLTVPASGTAALLATANVFTAAQTINVNSTTGLLVERTGVTANVLTVDTTNGRVGINIAPSVTLHTLRNTTSTNTVVEAERAEARVSTAATGSAQGFGVSRTWYGESDTDGNYRQMGQFDYAWFEATDATRKARGNIYVFDTAARLAIRLDATGTASQVYLAGNTGVGAAATLNDRLYVNATWTDFTTDKTAIQALVYSNAGSDGGKLYSFVTNAYHIANFTLDLLTGNSAVVIVAGTGTVTSARSFSGSVSFSGAANAGTITNGYVFNAGAPGWPAGNTGTIGTMIGLNISNMGDSRVTNAYGIYIVGQANAATNNYAIYTNTGLHRFGDQLAIVGTADRRQFSVLGYSTQAVATSLVQFARNDTAAGISSILGLNALGSGAAGDGGLINMAGKSSTTAAIQMAQIDWQWATATHASRKARLTISAFDTAIREGLRIEASGSAPMIGFLGAAAVARPAAYTQTYSTATRTINPTSTGAFTGIDNAQAGAVYAKVADLNTLRTDLLSAIQAVNQIIDDLQAYGLAA
jgi:hypothetical protein